MSSLSRVFLHYVWAVADRKPAIRKPYRRELAKYIANRCLKHNCSPIAIGIVSDHMHLLVRHELTVYIPDFAKDIKALRAIS